MSDVSFWLTSPDLIAGWIETHCTSVSGAFVVCGERACSDARQRNALTLKMRFVGDNDIIASITALGSPKSGQCERHFVGICVPSTIRDPDSPERGLDGWATHVVMRSGARATSLKIPGSRTLSGPTSGNIWDQKFADALEHAVGIVCS